MSPRCLSLSLILVLVPGVTGCRKPPDPPDDIEDRLLEAARSYESFRRVGSEYLWAPQDCAPVRASGPTLELSASSDGDTHGRKLYALFVKEWPDTFSYVESHGKANPVGQVLVKEAWVPEEVPDEPRPLPTVSRQVKIDGQEMTDVYAPFARRDGKLYRAREKSALFVMLKLDPQTPGTDQGWVYGTVTPDGKQVTSAGRVASCMKCHEKAPYDRLFGPARP